MLLSVLLLSTLGFASSVSAAFGFTKSGNNYVIDAGSSEPLVFTVSGTSCDITSIKYRNNELQGQTKGSHISSGLGTATVTVSLGEFTKDLESTPPSCPNKWNNEYRV
jgi:rhamnogalacturonan endolyase